MSYTEKGIEGGDGRMDAPAFHRNHTFIVDVLRSELAQTRGHVLEVGSGSGQHSVQYAKAFPNITFWPTDLNLNHVQSIEAWRQFEGLENIGRPAQLDVTDAAWKFGEQDHPPENLVAMISLNMIHISPLEVAENLFRGAGEYLAAAGKLFLYGPFKINGVHTAPSNAEFDATLKAQDPAWGVRDIGELEEFAQFNNLVLDRRVPMPANNFILIFSKAIS